MLQGCTRLWSILARLAWRIAVREAGGALGVVSVRAAAIPPTTLRMRLSAVALFSMPTRAISINALKSVPAQRLRRNLCSLKATIAMRCVVKHLVFAPRVALEMRAAAKACPTPVMGRQSAEESKASHQRTTSVFGPLLLASRQAMSWTLVAPSPSEARVM